MGTSFVEKQYLHIYTKVKKSKNTIFDVETKFADSLKVVIDSLRSQVLSRLATCEAN